MDLPAEVTDKKQLVREFIDLEEINSRQAKSRAVVLEILGDIPDADVAPPKNVLFVCKLNPVTEQDDLKIIFSRFGNVKSCDIIRDYKTGDSLQYAFVEFDTEDACNDAYFKMQNVLIDDRRIHVDFCQSVSGFWKRFRENGKFTKKGRGNFKPFHKERAFHRSDYGENDHRLSREYNSGDVRHRKSHHRSRSRSYSPYDDRYRRRDRDRSRDRHRRHRHIRSRSVERERRRRSTSRSRR
ncbi:peptidyl-prolyl cis-trans isomerase-like 4 like protein [Babesia gibsoni]|uniref:peptidylprolyl isomerase n=1 Tax=Babesia gibsoni TaxID=33632 RepID=A0AAD8PGD6_BABGI|nr:peptidyl-prolyl cis-trans isomerase-like 4 like protein [Babesia gibsoni]